MPKAALPFGGLSTTGQLARLAAPPVQALEHDEDLQGKLTSTESVKDLQKLQVAYNKLLKENEELRRDVEEKIEDARINRFLLN